MFAWSRTFYAKINGNALILRQKKIGTMLAEDLDLKCVLPKMHTVTILI